MGQLLAPADHARLDAAIRAAEARTDAEIVCVVAHQASDWRFVPIVYAAAAALVAPWLVLGFTRWDLVAILAMQLAVFAALLAVLSWPPLRYRLVPRPAARRRAHQAAAEQFLVRGLGRTNGRTGVLIFVAVAERYACVIPDSAVEAAVPAEVWRTAVDRLVERLKAGEPAAGLEAALATCADALAEHRPPKVGDKDELPNAVIEF